MSDKVKYFGIPGSGKTSQLLAHLDQLLDCGYKIQDICFVTFSRSQARDFIDRIDMKYSHVDEKDLNYYGTIHHVCVQLLGWNLKDKQPELVTDVHRRHYLQQYGIEYQVRQQEVSIIPAAVVDDSYVDELDDGNKIFGVMQRCHSLKIPYSKWRVLDMCFSQIPPGLVEEICHGWDGYKNEHGLVDFDDMLLQTLKYKLVPYVRVLFVDEFQDITPLLHQVIQLWAKDMDLVAVAGDDDQTIYSWAGATPDFLLSFKGVEQVLGVSHRVPVCVLQKANMLISQVFKRCKKNIDSNVSQGDFIYLKQPTADEILSYMRAGDEQVFFLFRTNYLAYKFIKDVLIPQGIPFVGIKNTSRLPHVWTTELIKLCDMVNGLETDGVLSIDQIRMIVSLFPSCSKGSVTDGFVYYGVKAELNKKDMKCQWTKKDIVKNVLARVPRWNHPIFLRKLTEAQHIVYKRYMTGGFRGLNPYQVHVGTLHAAKGLEADTVFVFNNHLYRTEQSLEQNQSYWDCEARLYYVGLTRTKKRCVLVEDFFDSYVFNMNII